MGWCCDNRATEAWEKIERGLRTTWKPGDRISNNYRANGKLYFWEIVRRDQKDGGIRGEIWLTVDVDHGVLGGTCKKVGDFAIHGNGKLIRGPKVFKDMLAK